MIRVDTSRTQEYWEEACRDLNIDPQTPYFSGPFAEPDGTKRRTDAIRTITGLAISGEKRGTAHLDIQFERDRVERRNVGDYWLVTDADSKPACLLRITNIVSAPFNEVSEEFALSEGEGDKTYAYWVEAHERYFKKQCERWGVEWREDLLVVCESFVCVHCA